MKTFAQLKKNKKEDFRELRTVSVALLGDTSTQFLAQALRGAGLDAKLDLQIWEAGFDQIEQHVIDPASELYTARFDLVIIFQSTHRLLAQYDALPTMQQTTLAEARLDFIRFAEQTIAGRSDAKIIYYNYPEIDEAVFGNYANAVQRSFLFQLRKLNYELMQFASDHPRLLVCDLSSVQNRIGRERMFRASMYMSAEMVLGLEALPHVATRTVDLVGAMMGGAKKCIILDLDNTLWGGIIGDDGIENIQLGNLGIGKAFTELQRWLKKLKDRGILLAVCSKNDEAVAKSPFENHPDMVLRLDDIAVFIANWETKPDNINQIQSILDIGFDSMVFLDDSPFERAMVRESIPSLTVPDLPKDPAEYAEFLYGLNLFETVSVTGSDELRTKQYQVEATRRVLRQSYADEADFLRSLCMESVVGPFDSFNAPRVAQLSQRSNQFNLRTVRYTEADILALAISESSFTFAFGLRDRLGDHGTVATIVLKKEGTSILFIETWCMSCRVLKRSMENFTLNTIAAFARRQGFASLRGEYLPTAKNGIVADHYSRLGFEQSGGGWLLELARYEERPCHIVSLPPSSNQ